jgi:CubicO group peptidase (beta-lactamase class C family)
MRLAVTATIAAWMVSFCMGVSADLAETIETTLTEENLAGVAWMLIGEKGEVTLGAAGLRDSPGQIEFTTDTRFHVGSLTKTVLATGVLRLVTEGLIELDAPASRYLPYLDFDNPWSASSPVTVRHLLDHTAGLNDAQMWQMFSERPAPDAALVEAFPEPETQLRIRARPGSRFSYSNMGYTLLGMIIESVVGGRYETYLDQNLLAPLAMHDSTFAFTTQEGGSADPMLAWGHVDDGSRYAASPVFLRPAGQFTSTAADLARFAQFLLGDGMIDGRPFINEVMMRSRGRPAGTEAVNGGLIAGYSLGLGRRDRHGVIAYCHGGNIVGFVAMMCIFPDENKAFAYSVNTDSETADYGRLDSLFIEALSIARASPPPTTGPAADISLWHGWYTLSPNRFQTFGYLDEVFGAIHASAENGSLTLASMQQEPRRLKSLGGYVFSANDRETASHVLLQGENGEFLISDGFRTLQKVSTAYLVAHWLSVLLGLSGLAWLFAAGAVSLIRHRAGMFRQAVAPAFIASVLLFLPIPFFMAQSFMALGDFTLASALLAAVTLMLPIGMLMTTMRAMKIRKEARVNLVHGFAAMFVLQWCAVLVGAGLLPLRLWLL